MFHKGDLILVHGLQSTKGQTLNGRYGQIISMEGDSGRLGVQLYTIPWNGSQTSVTNTGHRPEEVALKPENLTLRHQRCEEFRSFLGAICVGHMQKRNFEAALPMMQRFLELWPEDKGMCATIANVYRETGRVDKSIEILQKLLQDLPSSMNTQRHRLQYDLCTALHAADRLGEAFDICSAIEISEGGTRSEPFVLKLEVLELLAAAWKKRLQTKEAMEQEEIVIRALLDLQPRNGRGLWNLGAVLCRSGRLCEGAECYEQALGSGEGISAAERARLGESLALARKQASGELPENLIAAVPGVGAICAEGQPGVDFATTLNVGGVDGVHTLTPMQPQGTTFTLQPPS